MTPLDRQWSVHQAAGMATILEASATKLGNVHPQASFRDMHFGHFIASAAVQSKCFEELQNGLGDLVLRTVQQTSFTVGCNTNLGTVLLLAPLAIAASRLPDGERNLAAMAAQTAILLSDLRSRDSQLVYQAIAAARPGGLGDQPQHDVNQHAAPAELLVAMRQASSHDCVARQYANNFEDIFQRLVPWLEQALQSTSDPLTAISLLQLRTLASEPDSLIARKRGTELAQTIQHQAAQLWDMQLCEPYHFHHPEFQQRYQQLDSFMRTADNSLNPGTTADLIAATLFCKLVCVA